MADNEIKEEPKIQFHVAIYEVSRVAYEVINAKNSLEARKAAATIPKDQLQFENTKYRYIALDATTIQ